MRRTIVLTLLATAPVLAAGCGLLGKDTPVSEKPEASPRVERQFFVAADGPDGAEAAYTLLDQEKQAFNAGYSALPASAQPSAFGGFLDAYLAEVRGIDLTPVPDPVRQPFEAYLTACAAFREAVRPLPDGYKGDEFMAGVRNLYGGHGDRAVFLGGDVTATGGEMIAKFDDVFAAAADHGLVVRK